MLVGNSLRVIKFGFREISFSSPEKRIDCIHKDLSNTWLTLTYAHNRSILTASVKDWIHSTVYVHTCVNTVHLFTYVCTVCMHTHSHRLLMTVGHCIRYAGVVVCLQSEECKQKEEWLYTCTVSTSDFRSDWLQPSNRTYWYPFSLYSALRSISSTSLCLLKCLQSAVTKATSGMKHRAHYPMENQNPFYRRDELKVNTASGRCQSSHKWTTSTNIHTVNMPLHHTVCKVKYREALSTAYVCYDYNSWKKLNVVRLYYVCTYVCRVRLWWFQEWAVLRV